jgi:hypothetical protein
VLREADRELESDACPYGLGGFSQTTGKAWRLQIPDYLVGRGSINFLEFLATVIAIRIDDPPPESCVNSKTDNTAAESWLKGTNFHDEEKANMELARDLGKIILEKRICLYSEYLPGDENEICDSLSRDFHLSKTELMSLFSNSPSVKIPQDFAIYKVPGEIASWAFSLVQQSPAQKQLPSALTPSKLWRSSVGASFVKTSISTTTFSSTNSASTNRTPSLELSPNPSGFAITQQEEAPKILSRQKRAKIRSTTWHRPLGLTTGQTLDSIGAGTPANFYSANFEDIQMSTRPPKAKKQSPARS